MNVIKDNQVCVLLKKWISKRDFSQAQIATLLKVHPSLFSRQLACKENIGIDKITKLAEILDPPREEIVKINAIITSAHEEKTPDIKKYYMDMISTTINEIGPDGLLSQILFEWIHFTKDQKIELVTAASKISNKTKKVTKKKGE